MDRKNAGFKSSDERAVRESVSQQESLCQGLEAGDVLPDAFQCLAKCCDNSLLFFVGKIVLAAAELDEFSSITFELTFLGLFHHTLAVVGARHLRGEVEHGTHLL